MGKVREAANLKMDTYIGDLRKSYNKMFGINKSSMRRSWDADVERIQTEQGYIQKPTLLTDLHKTLMYLKDPVIAAIVQTRATQVSEFSEEQEDKYHSGFIFKKRNGGEITEEDKAALEELTRFIANCGVVDDERIDADELMNFETFLKLITKDCLIYDPVAVEIVPDHQGFVHHFLPVSAASIRLAAPNITQAAINEYWNEIEDFDQELADKGKYKTVQVVNGQIRRAFTRDQLVYEFRNPVNDFFTNGYPIGELDLLMNVISAHINAETFNSSLFTNGFVSQGIINLKGDVDDEQLKALRRSWYSQGVGPNAMFKTPIINSPEGIEFLKLDVSHREMEYSNYINHLVKLMCAVYQISPEEIGFSSSGKSEGGGGNSQNYNNVEKRLKISRDRGLRPLLRFLEHVINDKILARYNPELFAKYKFEFVGLDIEDRDKETERHGKEVKTSKTFNEIRKEKGLPPIEGADFIGDPVFYEWYSTMSPAGKAFAEFQNEQAMKQAQQQQSMAQGTDSNTPAVKYVDEDGNPLSPEDIDPETMSFTDEEGNEVDVRGEAVGGNAFETEESTEEVEDDKKLPFEDDLPF